MPLVFHQLDPIFDQNSKVLILGSFPSPKSRESGFYYGHPQNRFWPLLSFLLKEQCPRNNEEKKRFLLRNRIALWDVLASCKIKGAEDGSISSPVPNDLSSLLQECSITTIFTAGKKATALYHRFCLPFTGIDSIYLPSTSPANRARFPMERLAEEWEVVLKKLKQV